MSRRIVTIALLLGAVLLTFAGCVTSNLAMETPSGFARYTEGEGIRIISPEGVVARARVVDNDPPQTIEFWSEALKRQLEMSGYFLVDASDFQAVEGPGTLYEWVAPVNGEDWIYLTAIVVSESEIVIVEAAGEAGEYDLYRDAIRDSLRSISTAE